MFFNQVIFFSFHFLIPCNMCSLSLLKLACLCVHVWTFSSWYHQIQLFFCVCVTKGPSLCSWGLFFPAFGNAWLQVGSLHEAGSLQACPLSDRAGGGKLIPQTGWFSLEGLEKSCLSSDYSPKCWTSSPVLTEPRQRKLSCWWCYWQCKDKGRSCRRNGGSQRLPQQLLRLLCLQENSVFSAASSTEERPAISDTKCEGCAGW